ncbi:uncharacterized protein LOC135079802 [Ostrinia nubilalis]|uniref:uncharacterized protein LOC135079802 n=1 Tax=Ostrinia nubilalis TaxID=29057 RepID=UPI0030826479
MADAESNLRALLRRVARDQRYDDDDALVALKPITSGGANYTSNLFLATLSTPGLPDLNLFAKVASISVKIRSRVNADNLYRTEQIFYNKLVNIWNGFQEKYQVPEQHRFVFPKYYGGSEEIGNETIILENLVAGGYMSFSRFKSVDWDQASKAVEVLAKYHALSFVLQKEDPAEYKVLLEDLKFVMSDEDPEMKGIWERMVGGAMAVIDQQHHERIKKFFEAHDGRDLFTKYHMPTHTPILAHGDFRPSNLLHKKQADGSVQVIVLDYQTVHTGCPVEDLFYFIFMGTDEEFRRQHYDELIELYYAQLGLALERYQMDVEEVYARKHYDDDLKMMLPYALLLGIVVLPVVTVEAESAPKVDNEADLDAFVVAPNELFASRFKGVVNDLLRWDVI